MKDTTTPIPTPFTAIYTQWLDSFRALLPGSGKAEAANDAASLKQSMLQAQQDWEDEGGALKPSDSTVGPVLIPRSPDKPAR